MNLFTLLTALCAIGNFAVGIKNANAYSVLNFVAGVSLLAAFVAIVRGKIRGFEKL